MTKKAASEVRTQVFDKIYQYLGTTEGEKLYIIYVCYGKRNKDKKSESSEVC